MKWVYKLFRALLVVSLVLAVLIPACLYVAFSIPAVQNSIRSKAETELTELLGMNISIDAVNIAPFSRFTLRRVALTDSLGDTVASIDRLGAGVSMPRLILKRRLVINYAEIIGLDARLARESDTSPLNIQPMLDALAPKDKNKTPAKFDFRVNTVVIRRSSLSYDVGDSVPDSSRFDKNHLRVTDLRADLRLPRIANNNFRIVLQRLALSERSGFTLKGLDGIFVVTDTAASVNGLDISLPRTHLSFEKMRITYPSVDRIKEVLTSRPIKIEVKDESFITPSDFSAFVPELKCFSKPLDFNMSVKGTVDNIEVSSLELADKSRDLWLRGNGNIYNLADKSAEISFSIPRFSMGYNGPELKNILSDFTSISPLAGRIINNLGKIDILGTASLANHNLKYSATLISDAGTVATGATAVMRSGKISTFELSADLDNVNGHRLFEATTEALGKIGNVTGSVTAKGAITRSLPVGTARLNLAKARYAGVSVNNLEATLKYNGKSCTGSLLADNPDMSFGMEMEYSHNLQEKTLTTDFAVEKLSPALFGGSGKFAEKTLAGIGSVDLEWTDMDDIKGRVGIKKLRMKNPDGTVENIGDITIVSENSIEKNSISLVSGFADVVLSGKYHLSSLSSSARSLASELLPQLVQAPEHASVGNDSVNIEAKIKNTGVFNSLVSLPVKVIYPVMVNGSYLAADKKFNLTVDAPYLQQSNRLLESTTLSMKVEDDAASGKPRGNVSFTTVSPTKHGDMTIDCFMFATDNHIDTKFDWKVDRERDFSGNISLSTTFRFDSLTNKRSTIIDVNPGEMVFNDSLWTVSPSRISINPEKITVSDFRVGSGSQYLSIKGAASADEKEKLMVALRKVSLDYVFETLNIPTAMFGGVATGDIIATGLLSPEPVLLTDNLNVEALSYNYSLMGDTKIRSRWDNTAKAVVIDAVVNQPNGCSSKIDGKIMPMAESLDLYFDADKIEVGFMKPFMSAFASEVSGYASGKAHLWGSFKYIDMVGDIYAEDLKLTLGFTNTTYSATDSVRLMPGHIDLKNITLKDAYGNTATLNGTLDHEFFKKPRFNFEISDAKDLLVYDMKDNPGTNWYGRVFGNGSASVTGEPRIVNIGVDMTTAPNSTFTFVLNDAETASDYTFITFRDRDRGKKDSIAAATAPPKIVQELKDRIAGSDNDGEGSQYNMNFAIGVTPDAQLNLIMDPVGGDCIKAYGSGDLRMTYDSSSEDFKMFGTYTLERGNYNFTLQNIIIKDFIIRDGSSISFNGNPYAAQLNIEAVYSLNANLSDLDESFLEDRELTRTNVPVHALMRVSGDMRQPDIDFDIELPTLSQDTYSKVKSIINTEDMMNRQIIYLLALNRFYTPDYMTATKGNEFVSVASSTLSSQLSSILGQLSENWRLAPNIRSDRGDFSDVEVDLALSSQLLNNRLLLNGNFGYRDNDLNNNSFIGDFDIEYLINRSGNLRLKAYNRYNDRNYYFKNALTTQGVGIVLKRDFDNFFSFLKRKKKKAEEPADSAAAVTVSEQTEQKKASSQEDADWLIIR